MINNAVFGKTIENVKKQRNIQFVTAERRNYLVSEPNYHTTKFFTENLLIIEMIKTQILLNKPFYLDLSILELSKLVMYKFWYDYVKRKYCEKANMCKTDDIYKDIAEDVKTLILQIMN